MAFVKTVLTGAKDTIRQFAQRFNTLIDDLLLTTSGKGASQVGIEDSADNMAADNVEDALAEVYSDHATTKELAEIFDENDDTTTGLTWGYKAGKIRVDNTITDVAAGIVSLTNTATNYVEISQVGVVSRNTTGFTSGEIPIRRIVCAGGLQTISTDKRTFFVTQEVPLSVPKGGTGVATLTDGGVLLGSGTSDITPLARPTNGQVLIGKTGADPAFATLTEGEAIDFTNASGAITIACEDASETNKGVLETATDAEAVAVIVTDKALVPSNIDNLLAEPPAIGGTTPNTAKHTTIELIPIPAVNNTCNGIIATMTVDANTVGISSVLHLDGDGNWIEADADGTATMPCGALALETGTGSKKVLLQGFMRNDDWTWTVGGLIYVSITVGTLTQTAPSGSGDQVQVVGFATHADRMFFNPSLVLVEVA